MPPWRPERVRYDAKHDILRCPKGRILLPTRQIEHGRFFYSKSKDCRSCPMRDDCLSPGRVNKAVVVSDDHPALLRARRRKARWSEEDAHLYQRHRWRSEGFHGEAKCWHGLARAIRRGLQNMRVQAFLTAMAVNLKRLAAALALIWSALSVLLAGSAGLQGRECENRRQPPDWWPPGYFRPGDAPQTELFNSPRVHWMRNAQAYVPKGQQQMVSAALHQAFNQLDHQNASQTMRHVAGQLRDKWPKLGAFIDDSEPDVLAFMAFLPSTG